MLKYQKVKKMIMNDIIPLSPGDKLESRLHLAKRYNTTRATLDKAMAELEQEGYLYSKAGSGTYVSSLSHCNALPIETWGVIVPNVMEEIYPGLVRGAENYAQEKGINLILCNSDNDGEKQENYIRRLITSGVSGIILVPTVTSDLKDIYRLYNQLVETPVPFVFCNRAIDGINVPVIASNDFYGGYIATKHLIEKGYRHPAFIAKQRYKTSNDRCQGYLSALLEEDIPINRKAIMFNACGRIEALLKQGDIDSVFCFDDSLAEECYAVASSLGISIPERLGIIGYNNTSITTKLTPNLSSVSFKNVEIGRKAAEILSELIKGNHSLEFNYYLFQPSVVERGSTSK